MKPDPNAQAAMARLGSELVVANHLYALTAAVRALLATHPEPERVKAVFDLLLGQMLTHQGNLSNPDAGIVLRDFTATLFQPPVEIDM